MYTKIIQILCYKSVEFTMYIWIYNTTFESLSVWKNLAKCVLSLLTILLSVKK